MKRKTDKAKIQELKSIAMLDIDLKPYFVESSIRIWEIRLLRLEQKMTILAPKLVSLSFTLHEMVFEILAKKIQKYLRNEEKIVALLKDASSGSN